VEDAKLMVVYRAERMPTIESGPQDLAKGDHLRRGPEYPGAGHWSANSSSPVTPFCLSVFCPRIALPIHRFARRTTMQDATYAIKVTRNPKGWAWELIDGNGDTAAMGVAAHQESAMESAWRAAKSLSTVAAHEFPNIVVGKDRGDDDRANSQLTD
jgi:hypothetical protein